MLGIFWANAWHKLGMGIGVVVSFLALVWIGSGGAAAPSLGDGLVVGVFVAGAACAAIVGWRRHEARKTRWILATGAVIAAQSLLVTQLALQGALPHSRVGAGLLVAAALAGLAIVVAPLLGLHRVSHVVDDSFAIGLGMGLVAASHLVLQLPVSLPPSPLMQVLVGVLVTTHVTVTALVLRERALSRPVSCLIVATVLVVAGGLLVHVWGDAGMLGDPAVFVSRAAIGAAWLGFVWVSTQRALDEDRTRVNALEQALVCTRVQRERLHELRSTLAGLVSGSEMIDRPDVPAEVRVRLWASVRRELDRMERLLSGQDDAAADLDLDEALTLILDLQQLKGRHVECHSNGDVVRARFDSLAEVLNILMDNAVTHGGTESSLVEVERSDEQTIDIRVTDFGRGIPKEQQAQIFDWGERGSDSPGEGIGLNLAQRLVTQEGGSLRLAENQGVGSSFVISLPAARRSPENEQEVEDPYAWLRSG